MSDNSNNSNDNKTITILGFGSLLSEKSSRMTFPNLINFRLGRVPSYRRVFGHPASIFFQRGIANMTTKEISSLSTEYVSPEFPGFVCCVFEVPNNESSDNAMLMKDGIPSMAFLEREEEFNIVPVPYYELNNNDTTKTFKTGILCTSSTNEAYIERWGQERFQKQYKQYGVDKIWGWERDSGLRPCAVYLRHCYLAAQNIGCECFESFLDETYLVDRTTTIRQYIKENPQILETRPPPELAERYGG